MSGNSVYICWPTVWAGARGGARASTLAVETVENSLKRSTHRDAAALLGAVEEANDLVLAEATRDPNLEGMGTTIVAALETREHDVAIASVGDSRRLYPAR